MLLLGVSAHERLMGIYNRHKITKINQDLDTYLYSVFTIKWAVVHMHTTRQAWKT